MRRKALQGVANTLCHMVDGDGRYHDDDRLAELGSGMLVIDALSGRATHDGVALTPPLFLAQRMHLWLGAELARLGLAPTVLVRAEVRVPYTVAAIVHGGRPLWALAFECRGEVATDEAVYVGSSIPGRSQFGASVQR
jgi:hypothetical protein